MMNTYLILIALFLLLAAAYLLFRPGTRWLRSRSKRILTEDALKHIFTKQSENRRPTLESIAGALSISIDDAAGLIREMEVRGLLAHEAGELTLTDEGRAYALRMVRAHRLYERHLSENTGYRETEWHRLAERAEHSLTSEEANALSSRLGYPSHDPHGDPIPTETGAIHMQEGRPMTGFSPGKPARITHIEDEPAVIYSQIVEEGLHTGMVVTVLDENPERVRFQANGGTHSLPPLAAKNITLLQLDNGAAHAPNDIPLTELPHGEAATVTALAPGIRGAERRRLLDLGLLPGTRIQAELQAFSGDPRAYLVRGALIALRADQAKQIKIKMNEPTS